VKKPQLILSGAGVLALGLLYFFGKTVPLKKGPISSNSPVVTSSQVIDFNTILQASKARLTAERQAYVNGLEQAVVRGDVKNQQAQLYARLAAFWRDSAQSFLPYVYYTGEQAKLENSEKKLTFAARLYLEEVRRVEDPLVKTWMANQSKELFERALVINPDNDSLKIELGSCFIFGASANNPQELMQGIQKILEVSRKDSTNMYAQLMLGMGGMLSGQLDRAIERLSKVVQAQPHNVEAVLLLAEAFERKGDKTNAIKWYEIAITHVSEPSIKNEIEKRIRLLK
jgi:tetratricopeptide (TPR) repeat protein